MGPYGQAMAGGRCPHREHYCAASVYWTGALRSGVHANENLDPNHPNNIWGQGYVEVKSGTPMPDDIVIWKWIPGEMGRKYGHIGIVVMGPNGRPRYINNFNGTIEVRDIESWGSGPRFFRRVGGAQTPPRGRSSAPIPDNTRARTASQTATSPRSQPVVSQPQQGPGIDAAAMFYGPHPPQTVIGDRRRSITGEPLY